MKKLNCSFKLYGKRLTLSDWFYDTFMPALSYPPSRSVASTAVAACMSGEEKRLGGIM